MGGRAGVGAGAGRGLYRGLSIGQKTTLGWLKEDGYTPEQIKASAEEMRLGNIERTKGFKITSKTKGNSTTIEWTYGDGKTGSMVMPKDKAAQRVFMAAFKKTGKLSAAQNAMSQLYKASISPKSGTSYYGVSTSTKGWNAQMKKAYKEMTTKGGYGAKVAKQIINSQKNVYQGEYADIPLF